MAGTHARAEDESKGEAPEAKDEHGCIAFFTACGNGDVQSIAALAKAGCNTTAKDNCGRTGLMMAAASGSAAAVQAVLALGNPQLEVRCERGGTVFLLACLKGDPQSIAELAMAGCDTTAKDNDGWTALMNAAASGNAAAVQTVLASGGAQLEARQDEGGTAFLLACFKGDPYCIAELAKAGCDTTAKGNNGSTAMDALKQHENSDELVELVRTLRREQKVAVLTQRAEQLVASGEFDEAAAALKSALSLAPDSV